MSKLLLSNNIFDDAVKVISGIISFSFFFFFFESSSSSSSGSSSIFCLITNLLKVWAS